MIVDKNGELFEDRRKESKERRKNDFDKTGGRRGSDRRKEVQPVEREKTNKERHQ